MVPAYFPVRKHRAAGNGDRVSVRQRHAPSVSFDDVIERIELLNFGVRRLCQSLMSLLAEGNELLQALLRRPLLGLDNRAIRGEPGALMRNDPAEVGNRYVLEPEL
jgi:hypothetical protein